jgi:polyhydroxyalkanoate synthesis regulator phasin
VALTFAQAVYLDDRGTVSFAEIVERSGLTEEEVRELVDCGALAPEAPGTQTFNARCVILARRAYRLREELALDDTHALAVVFQLESRIEALEQQLRDLHARRW